MYVCSRMKATLGKKREMVTLNTGQVLNIMKV